MPVMYGKELEFFATTHTYRWGGDVVPGVTSILRRLHKPALIQWAAHMAVDSLEKAYDLSGALTDGDFQDARKAHDRIKNDAADIGKAVHKYAEKVLSGQPYEAATTEQEAAGRKAFDQWLSAHTVEPISLERPVFSQEQWYAGTTDFYGTIDGERAVLDFKTSSAIWPDYWLQLAAYELALKEEMQDFSPMVRWIIRLDKKTGKFEAARKENVIDHTSAWVQLVRLNRCLSRIEQEDKTSKPRKARAA